VSAKLPKMARRRSKISEKRGANAGGVEQEKVEKPMFLMELKCFHMGRDLAANGLV